MVNIVDILPNMKKTRPKNRFLITKCCAIVELPSVRHQMLSVDYRDSQQEECRDAGKVQRPKPIM